MEAIKEGGRYRNLGEVKMAMTMKRAKSMMRDYLKKTLRVPPAALPKNQPDVDRFASNDALIWLGHSTLLGHLDGVTFIVDPMLSDRASPIACLGPKRFEGVQVGLDELPQIDLILITHNHYDHLDRETIEALHEKAEAIFLPLDNAPILSKWGVSAEKMRELDWYETAEYRGVRFSLTPSQHFSGRGLTDRDKALWGSWVVQGKTHSLYFSGDSGYNGHFREIGERYGPFDLACLECGAYNDAWPEVHMNPEESVKAAQDLGAKVMLPIHWAGFSLSTHAWDEPITRALAVAQKDKVTVTTPMVGETLVLEDPIRDDWWWNGL